MMTKSLKSMLQIAFDLNVFWLFGTALGEKMVDAHLQNSGTNGSKFMGMPCSGRAVSR